MDTFEQEYAQRVTAAIEALAEQTARSAEASKAAAPVTDFLAGLRKLVNSAPSTDEGKVTLAEALGENLTDAIDVLTSADGVYKALGTLTGTDRSEGDAIAQRLGGMASAGILSGEIIDKAEASIEAWKQSTPKSSSSRGSSSTTRKEALGFGLHWRCEACNADGIDRTDVNSARWSVLKHQEKAHGVKLARGDAPWQGITDALKAVAEGAEAAQGAGYVIDRRA